MLRGVPRNETRNNSLHVAAIAFVHLKSDSNELCDVRRKSITSKQQIKIRSELMVAAAGY